MVRIISDTSTLYSTEAAKAAGFDVSPLSVTINHETYRELDEISADTFIGIINQGHMPKSSQPAIGEVVDLYNKYPEDELINIAMADGLSGTYQSAVTAADMAQNKDRISVMNSRTLCGPHRYLVERAVQLAKEGMSRSEIVKRIEEMMDTGKSFLMPADYDYLRRGGRLSPMVSYVGKAIKLVPIMTQTEDGRHLTIAGIRRNFKQAINQVGKFLQEHGVNENWQIYIAHGAVPERAEKALEQLKEFFPGASFHVHLLTPAFITQGGPGCVAVQVVKSL